MEETNAPSPSEAGGVRRARIAFFSWFFALFGVGTAMLALLLIVAGEIKWSSPVGLVLLAFSAFGAACLAMALAALFRARRGNGEKEGPR